MTQISKAMTAKIARPQTVVEHVASQEPGHGQQPPGPSRPRLERLAAPPYSGRVKPVTGDSPLFDVGSP